MKNTDFFTALNEIPSDLDTDGNLERILIWVQTVCESYQQRTLGDKELLFLFQAKLQMARAKNERIVNEIFYNALKVSVLCIYKCHSSTLKQQVHIALGLFIHSPIHLHVPKGIYIQVSPVTMRRLGSTNLILDIRGRALGSSEEKNLKKKKKYFFLNLGAKAKTS